MSISTHRRRVGVCQMLGLLFLALAASWGWSAWSAAEPDKDQVQVQAYMEIVRHLADPALEGRGPETKGLVVARDYLADRFRAIGLKPAVGGSYFQSFEVVITARALEQTLVVLAGAREIPALAGKDFNPLGMSPDATLEAQGVFVGYGVRSPEKGYDSYAAGDLKGKVAVALRYEPQDEKGKSLWGGRMAGGWSEASSLINKARWAAEAGAVALVVVNPPAHAGDKMRTTAGTDFGPTAPIPVFHASLGWLESYLKASESHAAISVADLQKQADGGALQPQGVEGLHLRLAVKLERPRVANHNVAGLLEGAGDLADQVLVIGAHYDHVGYGHFGSRLGEEGVIHPGADDNASGTAGILVLAQRLALWYGSPQAPASRRRVLFVGFAAEERGLIGSQYMVEHLADLGLAKEQVAMMLNLDMIGRMKDEKLEVWGVASAQGLRDLVQEIAAGRGLNLTLVDTGFGPSDQASFYQGAMPVLAFFTGLHEDYHAPGDTAEKINAQGALKVVDLAEAFAHRIAADPLRLAYQAPPQPPPRPGAVLGVAIEAAQPTGVRIGQVVAEGAAAKAGLMADDVILELAGKPVATPEALVALLASLKPGQKTTLIILRTGQKMTLEVILG